MAYDERFLAPMRAELTRLGVRELKTTDEVDAALKDAHGTTLVVVNSICGCAARNARPAVTLALAGGKKPDALTTVFAGQDLEATARAQLSRTVRPELAVDRAAQGRRRGLHDGAEGHRRTRRRGDRARPDAGLRALLLARAYAARIQRTTSASVARFPYMSRPTR